MPAYAQDIDPRRLLHGHEALMKVQITYCNDKQTMLGITMAHLLAGKQPHICLDCYQWLW